MLERENLVLDSLIYLEPVERFLNKRNNSNAMKFKSFAGSPSSRVKDKFKTVRLSKR